MSPPPSTQGTPIRFEKTITIEHITGDHHSQVLIIDLKNIWIAHTYSNEKHNSGREPAFIGISCEAVVSSYYGESETPIRFYASSCAVTPLHDDFILQIKLSGSSTIHLPEHRYWGELNLHKSEKKSSATWRPNICDNTYGFPHLWIRLMNTYTRLTQRSYLPNRKFLHPAHTRCWQPPTVSLYHSCFQVGQQPIKYNRRHEFLARNPIRDVKKPTCNTRWKPH